VRWGLSLHPQYRPDVQTSDRLRVWLTLTGLALAPALLIELLIALTRSLLSAHSSGLVAETMGGITWSLLVCFGVAAGSALSRMSEAVASAVAFVCTPIALLLSKAVQGGVNEVLEHTSTSLPPGLGLIAAVKACEYAALAYVLARLANAGVHALAPHLVAGLGAAAVFGTTIVAIAAKAPNPDLGMSAIATTSINEALFPLGCVVAVLLTRGAQRTTDRAPGY
jgi:hypothetical protein